MILNIKICKNKPPQLSVLRCFCIYRGSIQILVSIPNDLKRSRSGTRYEVYITRRCSVPIVAYCNFANAPKNHGAICVC
jgi:hypothetical protein